MDGGSENPTGDALAEGPTHASGVCSQVSRRKTSKQPPHACPTEICSTRSEMGDVGGSALAQTWKAIQDANSGFGASSGSAGVQQPAGPVAPDEQPMPEGHAVGLAHPPQLAAPEDTHGPMLEALPEALPAPAAPEDSGNQGSKLQPASRRQTMQTTPADQSPGSCWLR